MYTEEPKKTIDWSTVIKKGLLIIFVAIVIFLIIWLLTRNNTNGIDVDYNGDNGNKLNANTYSEIFIDNYRYFHDTAKEYFLISNLPEKNSTIKFTLQELIDKDLILNFGYTDNEICDTEASYVSVKNEDGKYIMTTTLVCGREVATTREELGCNQICVDKMCECKCDGTTNAEKILEYQYKQPYTANQTVYSCPNGYTKSGSKCIKSSSATAEVIKNTVYTCPDGYTKSGDKCVSDNENTVDAKKTYTYICPNGYTKTGSGENTKCYKNTEDKVKATLTYNYNCPDGYTKSGSGENTKCTKTTNETINAMETTTYSCSSGSLSGSNCVSSSSYSTNAKTKTTYTCKEGTLVNEKYCRVTTSTSGYKKYTSYKGTQYNGCKYSGSYTSSCGTNCTKTYYKYYCSGSSSTDKAATATTTYYCSSGTLSGTKCIHSSSSSVPATPKTTYSCLKGTLNGNKCVIENTDTIEATKEKVYNCSNSGYSLNGEYCYKTTNETKTPLKTIDYSCEDGYTKTGSGENTKCTKKTNSTVEAYKNVTYSCEDGYTKVGFGASATCTKGTNTSINATKTTSKVTKYNYKWSTETSLDGWEKTGKTRYVEASSK